MYEIKYWSIDVLFTQYLTHNGEYWFAKLSWGKDFYQFGLLTLIIHKSNSSSDVFCYLDNGSIQNMLSRNSRGVQLIE